MDTIRTFRSRLLLAMGLGPLAAATIIVGCGSDDSTTGGSGGNAGAAGAMATGGDGGAGGGSGTLQQSGSGGMSGIGNSGGNTSTGDASATGDSAIEETADASDPACPKDQPKVSTTCSPMVIGYCYYGQTICACPPEGGFAGEGGARYSWACGMATAGCPKIVPRDGSPCLVPGMSCNYDFRACASGRPGATTCDNGIWKTSPTPCS